MRMTLFAMLLCGALWAQDVAKDRAEFPVKRNVPRQDLVRSAKFVSKSGIEVPLKTAILKRAADPVGALRQDRGKKEAEAPIREIVRSPKPEKYDLSKTGITWHEGIDAVLNQRRPILLFQLLGNFDDVYC